MSRLPSADEGQSIERAIEAANAIEDELFAIIFSTDPSHVPEWRNTIERSSACGELEDISTDEIQALFDAQDEPTQSGSPATPEATGDNSQKEVSDMIAEGTIDGQASNEAYPVSSFSNDPSLCLDNDIYPTAGGGILPSQDATANDSQLFSDLPAPLEFGQLNADHHPLSLVPDLPTDYVTDNAQFSQIVYQDTPLYFYDAPGVDTTDDTNPSSAGGSETLHPYQQTELEAFWTTCSVPEAHEDLTSSSSVNEAQVAALDGRQSATTTTQEDSDHQTAAIASIQDNFSQINIDVSTDDIVSSSSSVLPNSDAQYAAENTRDEPAFSHYDQPEYDYPQYDEPEFYLCQPHSQIEIAPPPLQMPPPMINWYTASDLPANIPRNLRPYASLPSQSYNNYPVGAYADVQQPTPIVAPQGLSPQFSQSNFGEPEYTYGYQRVDDQSEYTNPQAVHSLPQSSSTAVSENDFRATMYSSQPQQASGIRLPYTSATLNERLIKSLPSGQQRQRSWQSGTQAFAGSRSTTMQQNVVNTVHRGPPLPAAPYEFGSFSTGMHTAAHRSSHPQSIHPLPPQARPHHQTAVNAPTEFVAMQPPRYVPTQRVPLPSSARYQQIQPVAPIPRLPPAAASQLFRSGSFPAAYASSPASSAHPLATPMGSEASISSFASSGPSGSTTLKRTFDSIDGPVEGTCHWGGNCGAQLSAPSAAEMKGIVNRHLSSVHQVKTSWGGELHCQIPGCKLRLQGNNMARHITTVHLAVPHKCPCCEHSRSYSRLDSLLRHVDAAHGTEALCLVGSSSGGERKRRRGAAQ